ncbi:hypothetical protein [Acinetobacter sp. WCHAc060025]|uniref:hypothetical protein n=1 Tax=Acinetobacter sp. WCHAc060025 TaxID=2518625 RepID=UPI001022DED5|nr:hypothetical protein [Acinetobacter sp. WCHAc060025]RZG72828.1 hypothetical protein EXE09_16285 [Acinetobacter sp. WCHAc060025]
MKNIILLTLLISTNLYAVSIFTTHSVPKKFSSFTGNIPYIQSKDFEKINQQIQQQLLQDEGVPIDFESDKIYQDHDYLSIRVNQEISGGRTYYRSRYFVIDLKNKKLMTLDQVIKKYELSATNISRQIGEELEPCILPKTPITEECNSADMQYLYRDYAEDPHTIDLKNADGFYLKKNILGISFDAGVYSVPFEFDLKTKKIQ